MMKRRLFVKKLSKGVSTSFLIPGIPHTTSEGILSYTYPRPESLEELKNDEGLVAIRIFLEGKSELPEARISGKITVRKGKINRVRSYFNLHHDRVDYPRAVSARGKRQSRCNR